MAIQIFPAWIVAAVTATSCAVAVVQGVHVDSAVPLRALQLVVIEDAALRRAGPVVAARHVRLTACAVELEEEA